jgi:carbonic anhydrase
MEQPQFSDGRDRFDRRAFCRAAGAATAVGVAEASLDSALAHADLTKEQRDKMTPDEIIQQMKAGNERFRSGKPQHRDLMRETKATAKGQYPAAIVFSCVDSRAPAELILDFGIGDIFSGRVAGNVADEDVLGRHGIRLQGGGLESRACHGWRRSVRLLVGRKNVPLTIANIQEKSSVFRDLESSGSIKIVGSMYNLETEVVEFFA